MLEWFWDFNYDAKKVYSKMSCKLVFEKTVLNFRLRSVSLFFFTINALSALLFIILVNDPVFDDPLNSRDANRYATEAISVNSIERHVNQPGPGSFIWMALPARIFGPELMVFRLAVLLSWLCLACSVFLFVRLSRSDDYLYGALLAPLIFPHAGTAAATVLTEGPSLFFAVTGALLWNFSSMTQKVTWNRAMLCGIGGLSIGIAIFSRQYFLSLLPAMGVSAFLHAYKFRPARPLWWASVVMSALLAVLPILGLFLIWEGLTSPAMAGGTAYAGFTAKMGLNLSGPGIALFYLALYLVPFTFPALFRLHSREHLGSAIISAFATMTYFFVDPQILQPGPLDMFTRSFGNFFFSPRTVLAGIVFLVAYNFCAVTIVSSQRWNSLVSNRYVTFSILFLLFFLIEQIGVGGDTQFFERYMLQAAPFIGIFSFFLFSKLDIWRFFLMIGMSILSHLMLWRYAWMG